MVLLADALLFDHNIGLTDSGDIIVVGMQINT